MAPRQKNCVDDSRKRKKAIFKKMFPGFKKKASELSVLCGNSVGFICYAPGDDEDLHVWPEPQANPQALPLIIAKFNKQSNLKRDKNATQLSTNDFQNHLEGLSVEELTNHLTEINSHLVGIRQKKLGLLIKPDQTVPEEEDGRPRDSGVEADSSRLALGFLGGDYFPTEEPMAFTGFCGDDCIWDSSRLDLEFFGGFETQPLCIHGGL